MIEGIDRRAILLAMAALPHALTAAPRLFAAHQFDTLRSLCDQILPGASEARAPELIDLLASENEDYRTRLTGGIAWLDQACKDRFGHDYLSSTSVQQRELLDRIAYRENGESDTRLIPGIVFFAFLRDLTCAGYFTSEAGMAYLGYQGNHFLQGFPGCPPLPNV